MILAATSGEGMTLGMAEPERIVALVRDGIADSGRTLPVCLGLSGASTLKMQDALDETADWPIDGYLIASPYYTRPSQHGLLQHFTALADHAAWPIVLYNIPYRTAVNIDNETMLRLAEHQNIVGLKDFAADRAQSIELLRQRPAGFRALTGEDAQYARRSPTAPMAPSCCQPTLRPPASRRCTRIGAKATATRHWHAGKTYPNSPACCCSPSRARRRPSTGWHGPD